ncbi:MAG: radical SAM family heme chaperone HemW, partial [Pseudomonadota bacterium]
MAGGRQSGEAFGVYVHWPFCAAKCPYCDFNSHVRHKPVDQEAFVQAYVSEISHLVELAGERRVTSIFFGGGTPSLMEPKTVATILNHIANVWHVEERAEISMEANPTSVEAERFRGYRAAGVNRISLGVQSLNDKALQYLGRMHTAQEAVKAIKLAQTIFPRMSFDMIYARPGQTPQEWESELKQAIDLSAGHLSLYQLTIEEGTRFFDLREAGKLNPLPEDPSAELYELTQATTKAAGFEAYEISNHALPGQQCQHNLVYWRGQDYAGTGPGAHGRLTTAKGRIATSTIKNPEDWWQSTLERNHGLTEELALMRDEQADEYLL